MLHSSFFFRPLLLAVAGLLWQDALVSGQATDGYLVDANVDAITIFAANSTTAVTRKFIIKNQDTVPLAIALYHNYSLDGSHVFNFRHHVYPKSVDNDPASHQNKKSTSQNWEWTWANRTGLRGQNIPHWWIVQNLPGLARRRLGTMDFSPLFTDALHGASMSDPRPRELSAVTIRVSEEAAAAGLPPQCTVEEGSQRSSWNLAISCEKASEAAIRFGCEPVLTELFHSEYYLVRVPEECSALQLRLWLEALNEDLPITEVHPNTHSEPHEASFSEQIDTQSLGQSWTDSPQRPAVRAGDERFAISDNWTSTECYKQGSSARLDMMDWSAQYDARSVYFEKQAQKDFSFQPVAFVISPYVTLASMDPGYLNTAALVDEGEDTSMDADGDGVKGNRYGMYYQNNKLVGAGLWDKSGGDTRSMGFFSAAFARTESGYTLGAAPLTLYYSCAAGAPGETVVSEAGVLLCLKWLSDNHRRLNITMVVHAYELKINWDFQKVFSAYSPFFPQLAVGPLGAEYDDPPSGKREVSLNTVKMPANWAIDTHDWGTMLACSERAANGTTNGGWAGAYATSGMACMYAAYSGGCSQTGTASIQIGNTKTTALAWLVGQLALLQHYNRLANVFDYRLLSAQKGKLSGNSPAAYGAPGVSEILNRFDPKNDHLQGLEKEFQLKPGESKEMTLTFTRENAASGVNDSASEFFTNRVGYIEVYASDIQEALGPLYRRTLRIPYRLDWGEDDGKMPRFYLGED